MAEHSIEAAVETRGTLKSSNPQILSSDDSTAKRRKLCRKINPTSFITWNVNGFTSRCSKDCYELRHLMETTGYPDVVCLQEVRLKASDPGRRGVPLEKELEGAVQQILNTAFKDYEKLYWSLADNRYAGTLTLLHNRVEFDGEESVAFTADAAISTMSSRFGVSRQAAGLPPEAVAKSTGSDGSKATGKAKQTSLKAFFKPAAPKQKAPSIKQQHHEEGRFQYLCFPQFDLVQTYVPNNGLKHDSIRRRREWDETMLQFFQFRKKLLKHAGHTDRPILWCGDLNCALKYRDGSHWKHESSPNNTAASADPKIIEYWADERKCLPASCKRDEGRHPDDMGTGFTINERKRLAHIMKEADLMDVWRARFPEGDCRKAFADPWAAPNYTWRGHIGTSTHFVSQFEGKGQRLDYFLVSSGLKRMIRDCEILGSGTERHGFCGSDHCPLLLLLHDDVAVDDEK